MPFITLSRYPHLQQLFWSAPGLRSVDERMLFSAVDRGWKWIDWTVLSDAERGIVDRLALEYGDGWIGDRHVRP